jgi:hypothetical protein
MTNPKKIIKAVKKATKKKPMSPKQKTYQIRGAENKRERELQERGGRPSPEFLATLREKTFKEIERKTGKPIDRSKYLKKGK